MSRGHRRVRQQFDWSRTAASTAVIETVADIAKSDPTELDVLAESIDPDALDRLVEGPNREDPGVRVTFRFVGYDVVVHGDGEVVVSWVDR